MNVIESAIVLTILPLQAVNFKTHRTLAVAIFATKEILYMF